MSARSNARVGAVVLAAGRSSRMGEAKQLLNVGGRSVLERTLENIRRTRVDEAVLVLGSSAEKIQRTLPASTFDGFTVVLNPDYEHGMAGSLRIGLSALHPQTEAALIVLADQPFIRPATFDQIIERYRTSDSEILIPFYRGTRGNPVLLNRSLFPEAMALEGDVGFRALFKCHAGGIGKVDVDDEGILLDLDEKGDYERLRNHI